MPASRPNVGRHHQQWKRAIDAGGWQSAAGTARFAYAAAQPTPHHRPLGHAPPRYAWWVGSAAMAAAAAVVGIDGLVLGLVLSCSGEFLRRFNVGINIFRQTYRFLTSRAAQIWTQTEALEPPGHGTGPNQDMGILLGCIGASSPQHRSSDQH